MASCHRIQTALGLLSVAEEILSVCPALPTSLSLSPSLFTSLSLSLFPSISLAVPFSLPPTPPLPVVHLAVLLVRGGVVGDFEVVEVDHLLHLVHVSSPLTHDHSRVEQEDVSARGGGREGGE